MEEINEKVYNDELNKSEDSIEETPKKFIPVPKSKKKHNEKSSIKR